METFAILYLKENRKRIVNKEQLSEILGSRDPSYLLLLTGVIKSIGVFSNGCKSMIIKREISQ